METQTSPATNPIAQWRLIAILFAGLTALLVGWYALSLRNAYTTVWRGLRPADSASIAADLNRRGVRFKIENDGANILVAASQADSARQEIDSPAGDSDAGFELFDHSEMGLTEFAQKIRYQRALQGELTRTILMMDGVQEARVHISMPERTLFRRERTHAEAAVTLVRRPGAEGTPEQVAGVQNLIAAAVDDLSASDVVVLNEHGQVISVNEPEAPEADRDPMTGALAPYFAAIRGALPGHAFEIEITNVAAAPTQNVDGRDSPVPAPAETRVVTRRLTVSVNAPLTEREVDRVRAALHTAGLLTSTDELLIAISSTPLGADRVMRRPAPTPQANVRLTRGETHAADMARPRGSTLYWWGLAGLGLALGLVIVAFVSARRGRTALSLENHRQFADRLRRQLQALLQGATHGGG